MRYWNNCQECGKRVEFDTLAELKAWSKEKDGVCDECCCGGGCSCSLPSPTDDPGVCPQCMSAKLSHKSGGKIDCPKCGFCLTCSIG